LLVCFSGFVAEYETTVHDKDKNKRAACGDDA
jgi:hypothetical protein